LSEYDGRSEIDDLFLISLVTKVLRFIENSFLIFCYRLIFKTSCQPILGTYHPNLNIYFLLLKTSYEKIVGEKSKSRYDFIVIEDRHDIDSIDDYVNIERNCHKDNITSMSC
jgi:hypothetical protein